MDSRESASRSNDEYYSYSPLGIFSDSYFTNPVQYDERNTSFPPVGLRTEGFGASVPQQGDYQPYQTQTPMDLHLLSAERYQEGIYPHRSPRARGSGSIELYGGLLAMSPNEIEPTSPPMNMKPRRSKKETSKSTSADESGTRQRGRPRLDTRDQTAAEVLVLI